MNEKDLHNYYRKYLQTTEGIHLNAIEKLIIKKFLTFIINENEIVQPERLNEETTYKCEICNKEKEDHEMCIITDVDLISKQYVCQNCLNGIK